MKKDQIAVDGEEELSLGAILGHEISEIAPRPSSALQRRRQAPNVCFLVIACLRLGAAVTLGPKTLRTLMKRSSLW